MTEALWIIIIVNTLGFLGLLVKAYFDYQGKKAQAKANKKNLSTQKLQTMNPNSMPGKGQACITHGNMLAEMRVEIESIKGDIIEIKQELRDLRLGKR